MIEHFDFDEVRAADLRAKREPAHHREIAERELAHEAAHDDEREQHAEKQIEEIVAGVDRGESDAERDADEELPLAGELEPSWKPAPRGLPTPLRALPRCCVGGGHRASA